MAGSSDERDILIKRLNYHLKTVTPNVIGFLKPVNLSISSLSKSVPAGVNDPQRWVSAAMYLIHVIITKNKEREDRGNHNLGDYIPLYSPLLKKFMGEDYNHIIDWLVAGGIIERLDTQSSVTHKSKEFNLTEEYLCQFVEYRSPTSEFFREKYKDALRTLIDEDEKKEMRKIAHLLKWLLPQHAKFLTLQPKGAIDYLLLHEKTLFTYILESNREQGYLAPESKNLLQSVIQGAESVRSLSSNGGKHLRFRYTKGRLHTPLTGMISKLRHFLTFDGEELISLDITSSQPLHFLLLFRKEFWQKSEKWSLYHLNRELYDHLKVKMNDKKYMKKQYPSLFYMFQKMNRNGIEGEEYQRVARTSDFSVFQEKVMDGGIYEYTSSELSPIFSGSRQNPFKTRSQTKEAMFHLMYHDANKRKQKEAAEKKTKFIQAYDAFKGLFPVEIEMMDFLKERRYEDFPVTLQKLEGHILLKKVTKKIAEEYRDAPLFTIHDSVITTKSYQDRVLQIMEKEYRKVFGFVPKINLEQLSPDIPLDDLKKYLNHKGYKLTGTKISDEKRDAVISSEYHDTKIPNGYHIKRTYGSIEQLEQEYSLGEIRDYENHLGQLFKTPFLRTDSLPYSPLPDLEYEFRNH